MRELIERYQRKIAEAKATQMEAMILAGCSKCGRRVVHDGKPIDGAAIVYEPRDLLCENGTVLCGKCVRVETK